MQVQHLYTFFFLILLFRCIIPGAGFAFFTDQKDQDVGSLYSWIKYNEACLASLSFHNGLYSGCIINKTTSHYHFLPG
ncbi:hypothetical protein V8F33_008410 [Rhypophila sp. PSN 637]